ncbi:MAG: hypothetical protein ACOCWR_01725, partial [Oceanidesulfovibrio sp.]
MNTQTMPRRRLPGYTRRHLRNATILVALSCLNGALLAFITAWLLLFRVDSRMAGPLNADFLWHLILGLAVTSAAILLWVYRQSSLQTTLLNEATQLLQDAARGIEPDRDRMRPPGADDEFSAFVNTARGIALRLRGNAAAQTIAALKHLENELADTTISAAQASERIQAVRRSILQG